MSKKKQYPPRFPRYAGGIRLQSPRGSRPREWWAIRWLDAIEAKDLAGRFARAKLYAQSGQVVRLDMLEGGFDAAVVGVRPGEYSVRVRFRQAQGAAREQILSRLRAEPMLVARLLAGDLPGEVESIFSAAGISLFPGGRLADGSYDMTVSCSCPDYAKLCKHVFAALIVLGEEIARRPLTLLALRGITLGDLSP